MTGLPERIPTTSLPASLTFGYNSSPSGTCRRDPRVMSGIYATISNSYLYSNPPCGASKHPSGLRGSRDGAVPRSRLTGPLQSWEDGVQVGDKHYPVSAGKGEGWQT